MAKENLHTWLWTKGLRGLSALFARQEFFPIAPKMGTIWHFPQRGLFHLWGLRHWGEVDTHTIPVPHLSHMGNFWAFPIDAATLVTGALTLLKPEGLLGSPIMRKTFGLARKGGVAEVSLSFCGVAYMYVPASSWSKTNLTPLCDPGKVP